MIHRVFVYGTLLRGLANHHWLEGGRFVAPAVTAEPLLLVDLGDYPALLEQPGTPVVGEVWEVDDRGLERLDRLEDYPALYDRRPVRLQSGESALVYVLRGVPEDHGAVATPIPSGDYRDWLGARRPPGEPVPD